MFNYFSHELNENEEIVRIVRKHWITFLGPGVKILLAATVPFFFITFLLSTPQGTVGLIAWLAIILIYAIIKWIIWYLGCFIITNMRVIDIDQRGLFRRTVSEVEIRDIQEMTYSIDGFFATMFGLGTCTVETAGSEESNIQIDHVRHPQELQQIFTTLKQKQPRLDPVESHTT